MSSPTVKRDWTTDLRLAKLALDPNNTPAWDISEQEKRPSCKMPLFVKTFPVFQAPSSAEVKCGCHYIVTSCSVPQQYLWLCSSDGINSHLVVMAVHLTHLRQVAVYHLSETKIIAIEAVPVMQYIKGCSDPDGSSMAVSPVHSMETVWLATDSKKILVLEGSCPEKWEEMGNAIVSASVVQIKYHWDQVFVALTNGSVVIFQRDIDGQWQLQHPTVITLDKDPVTCLLPLGLTMYCACGPKVWVVDSLSTEIQKSYPVQHDDGGQAYLLAHSGTGLWIALKNSATICLYHTETFRHLQDINVAANVNRILTAKEKDKSVHLVLVTSLLASKGLLWVGTNVGVVLTVPLPRLEGVPIITGRVSLAFHAHQGPVQLLLSLQPKAVTLPTLASPITRRPASADNEDSAILSPRTKVIKQISDSVLPSPLSSKRNSGFQATVDDIHVSGAKTLPRGISLCAHVTSHHSLEESNDVYGLYADLMNVQDYEKDSQEKLYERLNHSDPELVHFHLNTLDRRVQQKSGRPRSWDLSTMAVSEDSDSSAAYDTTSTATSTATTEISLPSPESTIEEIHSPTPRLNDDSSHLPTQVTLGRTSSKSAPKTISDSTQKTVLMLTGGCGYINWKKPDKEYDSKSSVDAHVMIWEVKL